MIKLRPFWFWTSQYCIFSPASSNLPLAHSFSPSGRSMARRVTVSALQFGLTAFSQLVACELPGIGAAGNTAEQLMHGAETWEKPFLPLFVETLGHELCEILKLRIWYDEMSICTCTCYHYECPEATHSVENEDFCPQLTFPFNVQAEEFKSLGVGFNFILWDQGEDLWYTEYL